IVPPTPPTPIVPPTPPTPIVPPTPPTPIVPPTPPTPIVPPTPPTPIVPPTPPTPIVTPPKPIVTPPTPTPIVTPPTPTSIVTATPAPKPIVSPTPTPAPIDRSTAVSTAIDTLTSLVTSLLGSIGTPTPAPTPAPTGTSATATPMRTPIAIATRTPVFTEPPTSARTISDCPSGKMPIGRSTSAPASTPMSVNRQPEHGYDPLTCPQKNQVNYRSNNPAPTTCKPALTPKAPTAKPIAHSAPNCNSLGGDRDNDDFLIGSPRNTNCGSQQSDLLLTTKFSLLGASCTPGTPQQSTLNNVHSFGLTTQLQFGHSTLVNTASQCHIRLI
ncbi:hypothetical protein QUB38_24510, partial [Microcoleus sp. Aus8_D3]